MKTREYGLQYLRKNGYLDHQSIVAVSKLYSSSESPTQSPVWWFDLPIEKIRSHQNSYYLLTCSKETILDFSVLKIPAKFILDNVQNLSLQKNKTVMRLHLSARPNDKYIDLRGRNVDFSHFLVSGPKEAYKHEPYKTSVRTHGSFKSGRGFIEQIRSLKKFYLENGFIFESQVERDNRDPYKCWVLYLLSAGVRDERLNEVCKLFFERYPTLEALSHSSINSLARVLRPLGKQNKNTEHLINGSNVIMGKYNGNVPRSPEKLRFLSGIDLKIADCIIGYGYGIPAIPVDGHVKRVVNKVIGSKLNVSEVKFYLQKQFPEEEWLDTHEVLRLHGMVTCRLKPMCEACPIQCVSRGRDYIKNDRMVEWKSTLGKAKQEWSVWRKLIES